MSEQILQLNQFGRELIETLAPLSVELGILAIAVLLVIPCLRIRSAALRHFLWLLVVVKPLVAVVASSRWSVFSALPTPARPAPIETTVSALADGGDHVTQLMQLLWPSRSMAMAWWLPPGPLRR